VAGEIAIRARGVGKSFRGTGRATSLKERVLRMGHGSAEPFHALTGVDLEIEAGHSVGLIGPNGSGKSTLLKILTGILRPTTGSVEVNGRVSSLLELGAGFNGELSGRDNIYLNASLLGLPRKETDGLFDSIVEFSELAEFIDNPVKHYSSGMYVRLGFSVAVHVDPDILLVDEVLAVGDEAFARKCLDKIAQFRREGRTILFVTHSLDLVEQICDRGIVLDHGRVIFDGDPQFATGTLRGLLGTAESVLLEPEEAEPGLAISSIEITDPAGRPVEELTAGDPLEVRVGLTVSAELAPRVGGAIAVVMGAGDIPVWVMRAGLDMLPHRPGRDVDAEFRGGRVPAAARRLPGRGPGRRHRRCRARGGPQHVHVLGAQRPGAGPARRPVRGRHQRRAGPDGPGRNRRTGGKEHRMSRLESDYYAFMGYGSDHARDVLSHYLQFLPEGRSWSWPAGGASSSTCCAKPGSNPAAWTWTRAWSSWPASAATPSPSATRWRTWRASNPARWAACSAPTSWSTCSRPTWTGSYRAAGRALRPGGRFVAAVPSAAACPCSGTTSGATPPTSGSTTRCCWPSSPSRPGCRCWSPAATPATTRARRRC
jgi:ABC-2 type transport system ATP-binding protein